MKIKTIELTSSYIEDVPSAHWPVRCTIKLLDEDPEYSWRNMEHQLTPAQTRKVLEYIAGMVFVNMDITNIPVEDPTPTQIEVWKREKAERDNPPLILTEEETAAHSAAEADEWLAGDENR
jgi:hypothetical protein